MNRLTKHCQEGGWVINHTEDVENDKCNVVKKLGKLEDLEEEIGCPLEILFRALTNGVYVNTRLKERPVENIFVDLHYDEDLGFGLVYLSYFYKNKDYKKTWWLKENREE